MQSGDCIQLRRGRERRLRSGHLWVYSNEIQPPDPPPRRGLWCGSRTTAVSSWPWLRITPMP